MLKKLEENIILKATSGKETIARAYDVFTAYIDSDFKNWNLDKKGAKMKEIKLALMKMTKDGTFEQIFGSISKNTDSICLTQNQIIEFVQNYKDKLRTDGYSTFFLFKEDSEFFVAGVGFGGLGRLRVFVFRFSSVGVWGAAFARRFVIPQLALKNFGSESLNLNSSDTLPEKLIINGVVYLRK